jgi:rubrerythrin
VTTLTSSPPPFGSSDELMTMAHAMEKEAARRYRGLAVGMRARGSMELARLFEFLESLEEKHAVQLEQRTPPAPDPATATGRVSWDLPENFDEEAGGSLLLTPYRALAIAVRNEERAFAFYCHVAANAPDERLRGIAEALAKDELTHAWLLRRERRQAYRTEKGNHRLSRPALPDSLRELNLLAAETDWHAAHYHRALAGLLEGSDRLKTVFALVAEDEATTAREAAGRVGLTLPDQEPEAAPSIAGGLRLLEEAFERYSDIADHSKQEDVLQESQRLAALAVRRLAYAGGSEGNSLLNA